MARCKVWDRLNLRNEKWEKGYKDVETFYWYEIADHRADEEPPSWVDLTYASQQDIHDSYDKYKKDWCENEERIRRPMGYYGVNR